MWGGGRGNVFWMRRLTHDGTSMSSSHSTLQLAQEMGFLVLFRICLFMGHWQRTDNGEPTAKKQHY